jgi:uncharacterized RDD family membrane protein YckC
MPATITIITPENVELTYELAGIGSRFVAALLDLMIHAVMFLVLSLLFILGVVGLRDAGVTVPEELAPWILGAAILALFGLFWGYYILFETRWSGQSPGKRAMRLRVIKDGGYPIDFRAAMLRNLMRYVDWLPAFYAVGFASVFFSRDYKRLGDFVAGTLVVRERPTVTPQRLVIPEVLQGQAEPPPFEVGRLTRSEYLAVRHYLNRRGALPPPTREQLAVKLARPLIARLEWRQGEPPADPQLFLETIARWYERTHGV